MVRGDARRAHSIVLRSPPLEIRGEPSTETFQIVADGERRLQGMALGVTLQQSEHQAPEVTRLPVQVQQDGSRWRLLGKTESPALAVVIGVDVDGDCVSFQVQEVRNEGAEHLTLLATHPLLPTPERGLLWQPCGPSPIQVLIHGCRAQGRSRIEPLRAGESRSSSDVTAAADLQGLGVVAWCSDDGVQAKFDWVSFPAIDGLKLNAALSTSPVVLAPGESVSSGRGTLRLAFCGDVAKQLELLAQSNQPWPCWQEPESPDSLDRDQLLSLVESLSSSPWLRRQAARADWNMEPVSSDHELVAAWWNMARHGAPMDLFRRPGLPRIWLRAATNDEKEQVLGLCHLGEETERLVVDLEELAPSSSPVWRRRFGPHRDGRSTNNQHSFATILRPRSFVEVQLQPMDPESSPSAPGPALELQQSGPRLQQLRVHLGRRFDPEQDQETLQQALVSMTNGTVVFVVLCSPPKGALTAVPEQLFALSKIGFSLASDLAPGLQGVELGGLPSPLPKEATTSPDLLVCWQTQIPAFFGDTSKSATSGAMLVAPRTGRGLCLVLAPCLEPHVPELLEQWQRPGFLEDWTDQLANVTRQWFANPAPATSRDPWLPLVHSPWPSLEPLDVGDSQQEAAAAYGLEPNGELTVGIAPTQGTALHAELGRTVRGEESFLLRITPLEQAQLVVVRRTCPEDAGKVLRVFLDEEDLGPWHLGARGPEGCWSNDLFWIAPELLEDRPQATLGFRLESGGTVQSFRYRFLQEEDPEGLWLTELDPESDSTEEHFLDRDSEGTELILGERWFLRSIGARGVAEFHYELPAAYHWFEAWVGVEEGAIGRSCFQILIDGEVKFHSEPLSCQDPPLAARARLRGPCRLTLRIEPESDSQQPSAHFANPVLLRDPERDAIRTPASLQ